MATYNADYPCRVGLLMVFVALGVLLMACVLEINRIRDRVALLESDRAACGCTKVHSEIDGKKEGVTK